MAHLTYGGVVIHPSKETGTEEDIMKSMFVIDAVAGKANLVPSEYWGIFPKF